MFRLIRPTLVFIALAASLYFTGCKSMGGGSPAGQAQVTVTGVLEPQIETKAEEVFERHGFDFKGSGDGRMDFERAGGLMGNILYGNWQENDVTTRVTLFIIQKDPTTFALRARSIAVRHTFGADSDTELFDVQGARYKVILDKIAKELREENAAR
ncbi:MAG: hypothetical protein PHC88_09830 [Terrimicrobiaceae bacterium]|nr:hypothetical protein [Terrimicrobiaceae bacterium]